jgi:hypothetical protein
MGFVYIGLVALIANLRNREYAALARHLEAEARQSALSRQLAESELKLLQSQVEPHFLFNTLGSAQQLAEKGAPEAARLIADLIRFLRAATPALRREWAPLADEVAMVDAYLAIMRTRLGHRLAVRLDVPASLGRLPVPPGMRMSRNARSGRCSSNAASAASPSAASATTTSSGHASASFSLSRSRISSSSSAISAVGGLIARPPSRARAAQRSPASRTASARGR